MAAELTCSTILYTYIYRVELHTGQHLEVTFDRECRVSAAGCVCVRVWCVCVCVCGVRCVCVSVVRSVCRKWACHTGSK